ncbi:hypothetical protein PCANC_17678 [Puccinia coronata f. sp. avenae]|uniref:Conserved oligomeric Golgi complex subunit 3 C-terminal domain-containing protein n=1 Tax=Puccinia coronata f. sp. avenae TaxID=200324 RepID=A0A2N5U949_9BASI|nr:hypothetical protein PCANC_17678 [Puccinia coronata f. sp. avenae]
MLGRPGNEWFPGSLGVQRWRRGLVEVANTTNQQNTTNQPTPQTSNRQLSDQIDINVLLTNIDQAAWDAAVTKLVNIVKAESPQAFVRLGFIKAILKGLEDGQENGLIKADSESVYLNHLSTTATLSLIILFSSLINALPSGIPTGNYITQSESYQGSYPSYYYGQQLAPYGYGQYLAPAYYSSGQGALVRQNYGYTGRSISNGAVIGNPGQVWERSERVQAVPTTIAWTTVAGVASGRQGVSTAKQGVANGKQGGGAQDNVRVTSRCGNTEDGGKFCETTRTSGDVQLLDNASNSQAAQLQALACQVNKDLNIVNGTLTPTSADGQATANIKPPMQHPQLIGKLISHNLGKMLDQAINDCKAFLNERQLEGMLDNQKVLGSIATALSNRLAYFRRLDQAQCVLSSPGEAEIVNSPKFLPMIESLDLCLEFMKLNILHEQKLDLLCDLATISNVMIDMDSNLIEADQSRFKFSTLLKPILQDIQTRLVFRAQAIIQMDVANYLPKHDDLDYHNKLIQADQKGQQAGLKSKRSNHPPPPLLDHPHAPLKSRLPTESVQETWYPTLRKTLWVLSRLHTYVNDAIFEDFDGQAVGICSESIIKASSMINSVVVSQQQAGSTSGTNRSQMQANTIDGELFVTRHLLILKEMIRTLDVFQVERAVDLGPITDPADGLLKADVVSERGQQQHLVPRRRNEQPAHHMALNLDSFDEQITKTIDSKSELDVKLKAICQQSILSSSSLICANSIKPFMTKRQNYLNLEATMSPSVPLNSSSTANPASSLNCHLGSQEWASPDHVLAVSHTFLTNLAQGLNTFFNRIALYFHDDDHHNFNLTTLDGIASSVHPCIHPPVSVMTAVQSPATMSTTSHPNPPQKTSHLNDKLITPLKQQAATRTTRKLMQYFLSTRKHLPTSDPPWTHPKNQPPKSLM